MHSAPHLHLGGEGGKLDQGAEGGSGGTPPPQGGVAKCAKEKNRCRWLSMLTRCGLCS